MMTKCENCETFLGVDETDPEIETCWNCKKPWKTK